MQIHSLPWDDNFQYDCLQLYNTQVLPKVQEINETLTQTSVLRNLGKQALADEELRKVGLERLGDRAMNTLSTGEKRRVLLARAAITDPEILLLDEASSGLDFPSRADLRDTIAAYTTGNRTLVMVTHELSEILPSINRIILMKDGQIAMDGTKEETLREDILSDLYGRKVMVACRDGIYTAFS